MWIIEKKERGRKKRKNRVIFMANDVSWETILGDKLAGFTSRGEGRLIET